MLTNRVVSNMIQTLSTKTFQTFMSLRCPLAIRSLKRWTFPSFPQHRNTDGEEIPDIPARVWCSVTSLSAEVETYNFSQQL